ncbi:MAG: YdeI/OmpD-associated family protein [Acidimicrobiales bacterium]|jgi:hypothetical protein
MPSPEPARFQAELQSAGRGGAAFAVPHEVAASLSQAKRPPVTVTVGGHTFRTRLAVYGGQPMVGVRKSDRAAAGIDLGDRFEVAVALDTEPRSVEVPPELGEALAGRPDLAAVFDGLSFSHRREYAQWVGEAKRPETRARRVAGTLDRLAGRGDDDQAKPRSEGADG